MQKRGGEAWWSHLVCQGWEIALFTVAFFYFQQTFMGKPVQGALQQHSAGSEWDIKPVNTSLHPHNLDGEA